MKRGDRQRGDSPGDGQSFPKRRMPPPPRTDLEEGFWEESKRRRTPLVFALRGGERLRGAVADVDDGTVRILLATGREVVVNKTDIRYIEEGAQKGG